VFCGEWNIGRIYEVEGARSIYGGFGRCTSRASRRTSARITAWPTLEAARAEFEAIWRQWLAWAKLKEEE
jgi:hypothetical protein